MKGVPLTQAQRQQIIDLRQGPSPHTYKEIVAITHIPYNTVAHICRDEGLQKEEKQVIVLIRDPSGIFKLGPRDWNQCDLAAMLELSALPEGFIITIGPHRIKVQGGAFIRDDGCYCPPNHSSALKWYKPEEAKEQ